MLITETGTFETRLLRGNSSFFSTESKLDQVLGRETTALGGNFVLGEALPMRWNGN